MANGLRSIRAKLPMNTNIRRTKTKRKCLFSMGLCKFHLSGSGSCNGFILELISVCQAKQLENEMKIMFVESLKLCKSVDF